MIRTIALLMVSLVITFLIIDNAWALSKICELAERLYLQGDYKSAAYECEGLFEKYKSGELRIEVAYLAGLSYLKLNSFSKSKRYFEYILDNSTNPLLKNEAQIGLGYILEGISTNKEPSFFSIQMGSFKDERNAQRLYNRFKRRGYTVRITEEKEGLVTVYKVKIGKFKSRAEATQFAKKLRNKGYQTAIVAY